MKKNYTHLVLVLDESGSMGPRTEDVKGSIAQLIKENTDENPTTISIYSFNQLTNPRVRFVPIKDAGFVRYEPNGMTALHDAVGIAINEVGHTLAAMKEDNRPEKVLFVVVTDGFENASKEFKAPQLKKMIERQKADYSWQFVYLGAGEEFLEQGTSMGVSSYSYQPDQYNTTFRSLSSSIYTARTTDTSLDDALSKNGLDASL